MIIYCLSLSSMMLNCLSVLDCWLDETRHLDVSTWALGHFMDQANRLIEKIINKFIDNETITSCTPTYFNHFIMSFKAQSIETSLTCCLYFTSLVKV